MEIVLETPRLLLRHFRGEDLDAYAVMCADPEVMRYLGTGVTLTRPEAWRSIATILGHWQLLGLRDVGAGGKGQRSARRPCRVSRSAGLARLRARLGARAAALGKGYAIEAARVALEYAFGPLGRERVISLIRPDNHRSIRLAERIGSRLAGEVELLGSKALVYESLRHRARHATPG
jgi:RimJ/RimL family protein N-acetyltransferase